MKNKIAEIAHLQYSKIVVIRRHLHKNPELSFIETNTSKYIQKVLTEQGIPYSNGYVGTGIVAHIKGDLPGENVVALRADMDALPIQEENNTPYCSINSGVMHACGHDVHIASLLGSAIILNQIKDRFKGTIKLIFQPGEEYLPGGAALMIKGNVLKNPDVNSIYGQHVYPELEAGKVGFKSGMYMASADELHVKITGKGGHAAIPGKTINPILIAAGLLDRIHPFLQSKTPKSIPTILVFGKIIGNGATNVIPDEVLLEGTFRTLDEDWRMLAHKLLIDFAGTLVKEMGGQVDFKIEKGYPVLYNNEQVTKNAIALAESYVGKDNVVELGLRMTAEDFASYTQIIPGCFYRLGVGDKNKKELSLHSSTFDVNEKCLETGMGLMAWIAWSQLQ